MLVFTCDEDRGRIHCLGELLGIALPAEKERIFGSVESMDRTAAEARATYTPLGYQMVQRGFAAFVHQPGMYLPIRFPEGPNGGMHACHEPVLLKPALRVSVCFVLLWQ